MPKPSAEVLPFALSGGWPDALPDSVVTLRETGVALGSLLLDDAEWRELRSASVFSLRIDEHPATDGWITRHPDGTETAKEFEIPIVPTAVPPEALANGRALEEWVMDVHGSLGRLLIWDTSLAWWLVHEPDLELLIICAPRGVFGEQSDELSWLPFGTAEGHRQVNELRARYGVT